MKLYKIDNRVVYAKLFQEGDEDGIDIGCESMPYIYSKGKLFRGDFKEFYLILEGGKRKLVPVKEFKENYKSTIKLIKG